MSKTWMIYGTNGYTGELIAREAAKRGCNVILAGRSEEKVQPLAKELGLAYQIFALDDLDVIVKNLQGKHLVLNCAGPFSCTAIAMQEACIKAGVHYLDITGEATIFEHTLSPEQQERAKKAGIILCSGVGFDVIPTDCVALRLKELLPDATHLDLGFDSEMALSPGTTKTVIEALGTGCLQRIDGVLQSRPLGLDHAYVDFGRGKKSAMAISWGDVSTAYHTTGIPNIRTLIPMPLAFIYAARLSRFVEPLLANRSVQQMLKNLTERFVKGPDEVARLSLPTYVWGEARNARGSTVTVRIRVANIYSMTVTGALYITEYILNSSFELQGGSYTPAKLLSPHLITFLPDSSLFEIKCNQDYAKCG